MNLSTHRCQIVSLIENQFHSFHFCDSWSSSAIQGRVDNISNKTASVKIWSKLAMDIYTAFFVRYLHVFLFWEYFNLLRVCVLVLFVLVRQSISEQLRRDVRISRCCQKKKKKGQWRLKSMSLFWWETNNTRILHNFNSTCIGTFTLP